MIATLTPVRCAICDRFLGEVSAPAHIRLYCPKCRQWCIRSVR